jgi:hypothetical protein
MKDADIGPRTGVSQYDGVLLFTGIIMSTLCWSRDMIAFVVVAS